MSASDIITYVGVPLTVLGILPILYNTAVTIAALSKIKRMLRHSRLTALTRSDVVNRVIEVELPRYAVRPWDRFANRDQYWTLSECPSSIPGGSWTKFNWNTNAIGIKTQRVEYADQLRQPQVEVAFDELICYLLDLGAVPDAHGWKLLRATGLWTPVGCSLMNSPDGQHRALTVAPLEDSDGHLSLATHWSSHWTSRNHTSLPPYWVRLPAPPIEGSAGKDGGESSSVAEIEVVQNEEVAKGKVKDEMKDGAILRKTSVDTIQRAVESSGRMTIFCEISVEGLVNAIPEEEDRPGSSRFDSLYIEHLRVRLGRMEGIWFASAMTAYGTTSQTTLWNYKIPDDVLNFSRKDTVPCGVLEILGVVDESMTPEWETKYNDTTSTLDLHVKRVREQRSAMEAEAVMPPAQRQQAVQARMMRENQERIDEMRDRMRLEQQRRETRVMEAMQSPKWDTTLVAEHIFRWLKASSHISASLSLKDAVGVILHRMVLDGQFTSSICKILNLWKAWADNGGMRKSDITAIQEEQVVFAKATLLIAVIKDTSLALEGTIAMDLQECMRMWKKVRLG